MSFTVNLKGKPLEIKFNYRLVFKANNTLGSIDPETKKRNSDGAGALFAKVLDQDDEAIFEMIRLSAKGKVSDEEIFDAMEDFFSSYEDEEQAYDAIFEEAKQEMLRSGFFVKKIKKYIENLEKAVQVLEVKPTEKNEQQITAIKQIADQMKKEISSSTVPVKD